MIETVNLNKQFGNKKALDSINLKVLDGSIFGLVGSNGSGKSTLLRLISGVYTQDSGKMIIDNMSVFNNSELKEKICYLPDTPYFIHQANINEMIKFYKMFYPKFNMDRFEYLSNVFPLDRKARISQMSKGMQRQAALMLCLSTMPKYLLLDEAFDGLDAVMRKVLKSLLADGIENGMTAIIATHNIRDLEELCDSVALLHNGKVLFNDVIDKIKENIHKLQIIFNMVPDSSVFKELDVLKIEKTGSIVQLVVRGEAEEIASYVNKLFPLFFEIIPPTFEEVFMYELEVNGYDSQCILEKD